MRVALNLMFIVLTLGSALAQTQKAIEAQYTRYAKAYVKNDVKTMLAVLSPKYRLIDEEGNVTTYSEYKADLVARQKAKKKGQAYTVKIDSLTVKGNLATAKTRETSIGSDGTAHVHIYQDIWVKNGQSWRLLTTKTLGHG